MKKFPKVAVLLATFNGAKFLKQQLVSITDQKQVDITIFYSDDLSTDDTMAILSKFRSLECINLNSENKKFNCASKNFFHLISLIDSQYFDYVCLSDQDDIWKEIKISHAISKLELGHDFYSGSFEYFKDSTNKSKYVNKKWKQTKCDFYFRSPGPGFTFVMSKKVFIVLQKHILEKSEQELKLIRWHDWYIYVFARQRKYLWFIDNMPNAYYRLHSNNETGLAVNLPKVLSRSRYLLSGEFRKQIITMMTLSKPKNFMYNEIEMSLISFSLLDRLFLAKNIKKMRKSMLEKIIILLWLSFSKR